MEECAEWSIKNPRKNMFLKTIDFDFNPQHGRDKETLERMLSKIQNMPCCFGISYKDSNFKGIHVTIGCKSTDCDMCRLVFDDTVRFEKDSHRPKYAQNVLFGAKSIPADTNLNIVTVPIQSQPKPLKKQATTV